MIDPRDIAMSSIDAIWYALGGKEALPSRPIRDGKEQASVTLNLGRFVVERRFTEKGSYLAVRSPDGAVYPSPQSLLDELLGELTFDPLAFARQDRKAQREMLLRAMGVSVDDLDARRKELYDERALVGREVRNAKAHLDEAGAPVGDVPDEEVSTEAIRERVYAAREQVKQHENDLMQRRAFDDARAHLEKTVADLCARLEDAEEQLRANEERATAFDALLAEYAPPDLGALNTELAAAQETNEKVRVRRDFLKRLATLHEREATWNALTRQMEAMDAEKETRLSTAGFPLEGLGLTDEGVSLGGIPFDQLSSSEQLRASLAVAMAGSPQLRIVRITDGSLLDQANLEVVRRMAGARNYQVWVERVDESGEVGIYLEDGEIAADNRRGGKGNG